MLSRAGGAVETVPTSRAFPGLPVEVGKHGLVLGEDQRGELVSVALFRPRPTRVLVIGGGRFAVLLGFRALALGARISIQSAHPTQWNLLVRQGLELDRSRGARPAGLPPRPELTIVDQLAGPPGAPPPVTEPGGPWSTVLTARSGFTAADSGLLDRADLTLAQPLPAAEGAELATALRLDPAEAAAFSSLRPEHVVVASPDTVHRVRLVPTLIEYHLIGDPADR